MSSDETRGAIKELEDDLHDGRGTELDHYEDERERADERRREREDREREEREREERDERDGR